MSRTVTALLLLALAGASLVSLALPWSSLLELWEKRQDNALTLAAYRESGGARRCALRPVCRPTTRRSEPRDAS